MAKGKRAESRCRYLIRDVASQKGWDVKHPQKGGDFLAVDTTIMITQAHRPQMMISYQNFHMERMVI